MQQATQKSDREPRVYGYEERKQAELSRLVRRALEKFLASREESLYFEEEEIEEFISSVPERLESLEPLRRKVAMRHTG